MVDCPIPQWVLEPCPGVAGALLQDRWRLHSAVADLRAEELQWADVPGAGSHCQPSLVYCSHLLPGTSEWPVDWWFENEKEY